MFLLITIPEFFLSKFYSTLECYYLNSSLRTPKVDKEYFFLAHNLSYNPLFLVVCTKS